MFIVNAVTALLLTSCLQQWYVTTGHWFTMLQAKSI